MNYIDLFSGIGGFALGAYWASMKFENHYCSDIDPYTQKLYKLRFPDSIQLGDITKIDTSKLPKGDWIITGGFPCQDISIAGKGEGIHGARSGLWFEYWRLIRDLRPRFAIMENVGMLIHRGLREVLGSLAEIGYNAEWQDIRAEDVGAPHRRERIWIVAYSVDDTDRTDRGQTGEAGKISGKHWPERCTGKFSGTSKNEKVLAYPSSMGCKQRTAERGTVSKETRWPEPDKRDNAQRKISDAESKQTGRIFERGIPANIGSSCDWREQAFAWSIEPSVGRLAYGVPHRVDRLKGLGNAIVPHIAMMLFQQIMHYLED